MQIDKSQILDLLRNSGQHDKADQAAAQLPGQVDTDNDDHKNLLSSLGINLGDLGALGGLGGIAGKLGF